MFYSSPRFAAMPVMSASFEVGFSFLRAHRSATPLNKVARPIVLDTRGHDFDG
jgi:hypothetical protein